MRHNRTANYEDAAKDLVFVRSLRGNLTWLYQPFTEFSTNMRKTCFLLILSLSYSLIVVLNNRPYAIYTYEYILYASSISL